MHPAVPPSNSFFHRLDRSALLTIIGVILLFSGAVAVTLIAPRYVDPTWTTPSSSFQEQMYEISDPHTYLSSASSGGYDLHYVIHLKNNFSLLAFKETETLRLIAPPELERFITRLGETPLKLTSRLLLLRKPAVQPAVPELQKNSSSLNVQVLELYDPELDEAFSWESAGGILQNWVDENYEIIDPLQPLPDRLRRGVIYTLNPREFRVASIRSASGERWQYDPSGRAIAHLDELKKAPLLFQSRKELISLGEHIFAIEGCWYCHTDQTRTLVQDLVLNGSDSYPAPPSSAHEYTYQKITFAGTRRIGPDLSRVGVKRPSRDWHKGHFWSPKTASAGSIMPAFRHFFDHDPRGTSKSHTGIPNEKFEAIYQYLMTKGTRITAPTQAWWLGKDPVQTKEIIEGKKGWWSQSNS